MRSGSHTRRCLLGSLAILLLLAGAGCPLAGMIGLIKLQIDPTGASKGLTVGDFEVTGLTIELRDSEGETLRTIEWEAEEGPRRYLIPAVSGEHEIEVTHFGQRNNSLVEVVDTATFDVRKREVTVVEVVPGCIGVIRIEE